MKRIVTIAAMALTLMGCEQDISPRDRALLDARARLDRCLAAMEREANMTVIRARCAR